MVTVANLQADLGAFENIFNIFDVSISVHVVLANSLDIIPSFTETWKTALSLNMVLGGALKLIGPSGAWILG